jgi:hypothetical protein
MGGTVRVRLTALYAALFLATSTILLVVVNLLLKAMLEDRVTTIKGGSPPPRALPSLPGTPTGSPTTITVQHVVSDLRDAVLRFQWGVTAVTIAVLTAVSVIASN